MGFKKFFGHDNDSEKNQNQIEIERIKNDLIIKRNKKIRVKYFWVVGVFEENSSSCYKKSFKSFKDNFKKNIYRFSNLRVLVLNKVCKKFRFLKSYCVK